MTKTALHYKELLTPLSNKKKSKCVLSSEEKEIPERNF